MNYFKKTLPVLLAFCIALSGVPSQAFAEARESSRLSARGNEDSRLIEGIESGRINAVEEAGEVFEADPVGEFEESVRLFSETSVAHIGDAFADAFIDACNEKGYAPEIEKKEDESIVLTIDGKDAKQLTLLSTMGQSADSNYQKWEIYMNLTGMLTLEDGFMGLGDEDFPFQGKISGQSIALKTSNTLFKALSASAEFSANDLRIVWEGTAEKPILAKVMVADGEGHSVNIGLQSSTAYSPFVGVLEKDSACGDDPAGKVTFGKTLIYGTSLSEGAYSGPVGLLCGELKAGTSLAYTGLTLPMTEDGYQKIVLNGDGAAGGLVGKMGQGSKLYVPSGVMLEVEAVAETAGGLVGEIDGGEIISGFGEDDHSIQLRASLSGSEHAGGIAGKITTATGVLSDDTVVNLTGASIEGKNAGGIYGSFSATQTVTPLTNVTMETPQITAFENGGGVFGSLSLSDNGRCEISGIDEENRIKISCQVWGNSSDKPHIGSVAGAVTAEASSNPIVISLCDMKLTFADGNATVGSYGGVSGVQDATLDIRESNVSFEGQPNSATTAGGISGSLAEGGLLLADVISVSNDSKLQKGGGVVGKADRGSILWIKNSLDISGLRVSASASVGQVVGEQESALVYAPNCNITRRGDAEVDDIGNYGELYRVDNLLSVDENYTPSLAKLNQTSVDVFPMSSPLDFACVALAWQSKGAFATVTDWEKIRSGTLVLNADINLTGCGIGGLSRDAYANSDQDTTFLFTGIFNGNGKTITLEIGGANYANEGVLTRGDGRIYWHDFLGLFSYISTRAQFSSFTIGGSIRSSDRRKTKNIGALAGRMVASTGASCAVSVATNVTIDMYFNDGNTSLIKGNSAYVGGLIGLITGRSTGVTTFSGTSAPTIRVASGAADSMPYGVTSNNVHLGSIIGAVRDENKIAFNGLTVGGSITSFANYNKGSNWQRTDAGALIGTAWNNGKRTITIENVQVKDFALTDSIADGLSGVLGGIWDNCEVVIDGLTVSNSAINSNVEGCEVGGLVYRASGKWDVRSVDLSGLSVNAPSAKALGLMVAHGEPWGEIISVGNDSVTEIGGLYLAMTTDWSSGYKVPANGNIVFSGGVFDEFVAYTAAAGGTNADKSYNILNNGSGIVSLKTENDTVNMDEGGTNNTYENRTDIGADKQTNPYSRYYYNLESILASGLGSSNGVVDTAKELLIWSVRWYSASNLKTYFTKNDVTGTTSIGGNSSSSRASFDMKGLSYYPVIVTNTDFTVKNADFTFYNSTIEALEADNKLTREKTQHYTMHCAVFGGYYASYGNESDLKNQTMAVDGVGFAGTVGKTQSGSGALICGDVHGMVIGTTKAKATVVLGSEDNADKAVVLNGITVDSEDAYRPVLLNTIGSYAALEAKYVTQSDAQKDLANSGVTAGSSLIGDVGGDGAYDVNVNFGGTIKLSETKGNGATFSHATLLESLRYVSGSGVYNFLKEKDWNENTFVHNVTYGMEITESKEYEDKCGFYNDEVDPRISVTPGAGIIILETLPYVRVSPATNEGKTVADGWHELSVNIPPLEVSDGCGTYGHPYYAQDLILAAKIIGPGPTEGDKIRYSGNADYHITLVDEDIIFIYRESDKKWHNKSDETKTVDADTIKNHLLTAYYGLEADTTLEGFGGLGTKTEPFCGIVFGRNKDVRTVTISGNSLGFILYSKGCVLQNLNIVASNTVTVTQETTNTDGTAEKYPEQFFGGAIGCVMGGDNIIENVSVSISGSVTLAGAKSYLIPAGGHVGVIAGGGVVFRGTCTSNADFGTGLYRNAFVGRVLGGYAFHEGSGEAPDNSDQNYKINHLESTTTLSWSDGTISVGSAQDLLVLSAIVSSGAASTESQGYVGGKIRNAKYSNMGQAYSDAQTDAAIAAKDAGESWSDGVPHLISAYASSWDSADLCSSSTSGGAVIQLPENGNLDMSGYDNGYRGLSARYVSNASFNSTRIAANTVVMRVKSFNGRGSTIKNINMDVKEYSDDNFHAASVGGLFNIMWTNQLSGGTSGSPDLVSNVAMKSCNVSLCYVGSDLTERNQANTSQFKAAYGRCGVSVGSVIGLVADLSNAGKNKIQSNYRFSEIWIDDGNVCGPYSAGGIIGATAATNKTIKGAPGYLQNNQYPNLKSADENLSSFGANFLNCRYSNMKVTAITSAGGFVGTAYLKQNGTDPFENANGNGSNNTIYSVVCSVTATRQTDEGSDCFVVGTDSVIQARCQESHAGGLFGCAGARVSINDPDVNTVSGLNIVPVGEQIVPMKVESVAINSFDESSAGGFFVYRDDGATIDRYGNNNQNGAAIGGIVGRIGGYNRHVVQDISIVECALTAKQSKVSYVGGLVGWFHNVNEDFVVDNARVLSSTLYSIKKAGGFFGAAKSNSNTITKKVQITNSSIEFSKVEAVGDGTYVGGLVDEMYHNFILNNFALIETEVISKNLNGRDSQPAALIGYYNSNVPYYLYGAGVTVRLKYTKTPSDKNYHLYSDTSSKNNYVFPRGYLAMADYTIQQDTVDGQQYPYVTSNPGYDLKSSDGSVIKRLTGDSIGVATSGQTTALQLWDDVVKARDKFTLYQNSKELTAKENKPTNLSTFSAEQGCGPSEIPVMVFDGSQGEDPKRTLENYLNVITNGGYSQAAEINKVAIEISTWYYNDENGSWRMGDTSAGDSPASITQNLQLRNNGFDNTLKRFSLVEAVFTTGIEGQEYRVSIPVIVKRQMYYDYMVTFSYGTEFNKAAYQDIENHVLERTGTPFTGLLTYRYGDYKDGTYSSYEWQTYLDSGGDLLHMDKALTFSTGMPKNTQLTLIDCQNGNQAYSYSLPSSLGTYGTVCLSDFLPVSGGTQAPLSGLGKLLGIKAESSKSGLFVEAASAEVATVQAADGKLYRPYKADIDGEAQRYRLTVTNTENLEENYYVVIEVPNQGEGYYNNGGLTLSISDWDMPSEGTMVHRKAGETKIPGNDDESTYQISQGYGQSLSSSEKTKGKGLVEMSDSSMNNMWVAIRDEISFYNKQAYGSTDALYLEFKANLISSEDQTVQLPAGTNATVKFYIQDSAGNYIVGGPGNWSRSGTEPVSVAEYGWSSRGDNVSLLLSEDGVTAMDISGVRDLVWNRNADGSSSFVVKAEMNIEFGSAETMNTVVPINAEGEHVDNYVQFHYVSRLSSTESSLAHSNSRTTAVDDAKYYRTARHSAVLSLDAVSISQLGINPLELIADDLTTFDEKQASQINLIGMLDVEALLASGVMDKISQIDFSLSLFKGGRNQYDLVDNYSGYLGFSNGSSWTISRNAAGDFDSTVFDGKQFVFPFAAYVYTDVREFANYKIVLTAAMKDEHGEETSTALSDEAYIVYTYACIKPEYYAAS